MLRSWNFPFYIFIFSFVNLIITSNAKISIAGKATSVNLTTLQLVQVIARHGDRAPILPYPNDLYKDASVYSINGWGELSEIGAKQVYELGSYLRQRYDGFLPRNYRKRDFLMLSSDIDRTIMSAEANLAGLYELSPVPRSRDIFKEWQPVPIHTIPQKDDNLINLEAHCPRYVALYTQFFQSDEFQNFLDDNKEFIDFIVENSGLGKIKKDFLAIFQVQDALRCQHLHNLTLPTWVNSTVYEKLQYFKALSFVWLVRTEEMKRLRIGPLLGKLVDEMRAKVEATNLILSDVRITTTTNSQVEDEIPPYHDPIAYRKMYVFSGHDTTISGLLDVLNLFQPPHVPLYAAALIIELHKMPGTGDYFIELLYKNGTTSEPFKVDTAAFCGNESSSYCSYQDFSSFVHKFIPSDWEDECQSQNSVAASSSSSSSSLSRSALSGTSGAPKLSLMRTAPADTLQRDQTFDGNQGERITFTALHPMGIAAPGLPGFVLATVAVISLLASIVLLSSFLRNKVADSQLPLHASYQNLG